MHLIAAQCTETERERKKTWKMIDYNHHYRLVALVQINILCSNNLFVDISDNIIWLNAAENSWIENCLWRNFLLSKKIDNIFWALVCSKSNDKPKFFILNFRVSKHARYVRERERVTFSESIDSKYGRWWWRVIPIHIEKPIWWNQTILINVNVWMNREPNLIINAFRRFNGNEIVIKPDRAEN